MNTQGVQSGGVFPQVATPEADGEQEEDSDEAGESSTAGRGKAVGEAIRDKLDNQVQ